MSSLNHFVSIKLKIKMLFAYIFFKKISVITKKKLKKTLKNIFYTLLTSLLSSL